MMSLAGSAPRAMSEPMLPTSAGSGTLGPAQTWWWCLARGAGLSLRADAHLCVLNSSYGRVYL